MSKPTCSLAALFARVRSCHLLAIGCAIIGCIVLLPNRVLAEQSAQSVRLLPEQISLVGPESLQRLVVVADRGRGEMPGALVSGDLTFQVSDPLVAKVEQGVIVPLGSGSTQITVITSSGATAVSQLTVSQFDEPHPWSFRHEVESVLARRGCSMGACHGALAGKGGFRLSLRGYDPIADWNTISRQSRGRRIELADPGRSLILAKPSGALPHKGGLRLPVDSRDYRVLSEWIRQGAQAPDDSERQLQRIEVSPAESMLAAGDQAQILVTAHYDDGLQLDVTHWAKFSVTDEAIAGVDESGLTTVRGSGQGAVLAWFGSKVALARVTVPYPNEIDPTIFATAPKRNFIDSMVLEQLETLRLPPSPPASDATFIRRATIDTIGRLPTLAETEAFLANTATDKRDQYIDQLLASEEFVDYWSYKWSDLLLVNGTRLRPDAVKAFYNWIRQSVAENKPWDAFTRELLTSTGSSIENGATNFFALHQDPENMTENAAQAFLGLSIGCAKCHNHPLEKWTNDQYYAMANLFARVRGKGWGGDSRNGDGKRTIYVAAQGDLIQPTTGRPQPPAPLDAPALAMDDPTDRRIALADWMVSPENPYFSRAITNRIWQNYFGVALVEAADDLRLSNPASNEPLLAAAAEYLATHDFDLKVLMREILRSDTYQRSSLPLAENEAEQRYYSRYYPRRFMAEVLLDAIDQTLATSTKFDTVEFPGADVNKTDFYPAGTRAIELYDSAVQSYFLKTFGRHSREITCDCQRSDEPSMVQVLHLSNGDTLNNKLSESENRVSSWLAEGLSDEQIIDQLFLLALSRQPSADEKKTLLNVIGEYPSESRREAIEDACWSVLTSSEFVFNQ
ncbi:DUF1549 domain-containing protein [Planctomycetaceae bacterium SH139]